MLSEKKIKQFRRYSNSRSARHKDGTTLLDGLHLAQEVVTHAPELIQDIYHTENALTENPEINTFLSSLGTSFSPTLIASRTLKKIAPTTTPSGILTVISTPTPTRTLPDQSSCVLLLDRIADPGNMGTIIRSGVALGADAVIISPESADAWSPKVLRAAQGAHFSTTILTDFDLTDVKLLFNGPVIGAFLDSEAASLYDTNLTGKIAICVGNEGKGISAEEFSIYGDHKVYIPMQKGFESLNVAMTTGIILSERLRQKISSQ